MRGGVRSRGLPRWWLPLLRLLLHTLREPSLHLVAHDLRLRARLLPLLSVRCGGVAIQVLPHKRELGASVGALRGGGGGRRGGSMHGRGP